MKRFSFGLHSQMFSVFFLKEGVPHSCCKRTQQRASKPAKKCLLLSTAGRQELEAMLDKKRENQLGFELKSDQKYLDSTSLRSAHLGRITTELDFKSAFCAFVYPCNKNPPEFLPAGEEEWTGLKHKPSAYSRSADTYLHAPQIHTQTRAQPKVSRSQNDEEDHCNLSVGSATPRPRFL